MVCLDVTETIIFKRVPNNLDVTIVQVEVIAAILRWIWSDRDWVFIGSEDEKVSLNLPAQLWGNFLRNFLDRALSLLISRI